jgi:Flp pilus assembly protein TadD
MLHSRYAAAVGHYHNGQFKLAWDELEPVPAASDNDPDVLNLAAICAFRLDQLRDASVLLQRAATARPDDAGFQANLGNVLTRLQNDEAAQTAYRRALEIDPMSVQARFNLSLLYLRQER